MMTTELCFQKIRDNRYKLTPKRKAVVQLLVNNRRYFTIQDIKELLSSSFDKIGIPTLYRILQQFKEIGIVDSVSLDDSKVAYFFCDWGRGDHHHFICTQCKGVFCLEFCARKQIEKLVKEQLNGTCTAHNLIVEGLCQNCREENLEK